LRVEGSGFRVSGVGCGVGREGQERSEGQATSTARKIAPGFRVSGSEIRVWEFGFRILGSGFRDSGFGFRVSGFGPRDTGFGDWDPGYGLRVSGFGIRESGFGIRDSGFGILVSGAGSRVSTSIARKSAAGSSRHVACAALRCATRHSSLLSTSTVFALSTVDFTSSRRVLCRERMRAFEEG